MKRQHRMPFGACLENGGARFALWAPAAQRVELLLDHHGTTAHGPPLQRGDQGWFSTFIGAAGAGMRYAYRIDGGLVVPDPASRLQPQDVHRPSALVDPGDYEWRDAGWCGRPWHEAVIYELHVGTFTREGTYAAAAQRLDDLDALGVTAIELMPLADFPGARGWGYDGVLPFAPESAYGGVAQLKALIDAAHARGIMVLLDVVYNHFGPDGNYLHAYAPQFFHPHHQTPWGPAINFDGEGSRTVRDFFIHNALYWLEEFSLDGLRLDAVHAIADSSAPHFIAELAAAVMSGPGSTRQVHLILENDANEAHYLRRTTHGRPAGATAQWNDDLHHALHVIATGERDGYYADFAARPHWCFGRALAEGFAYQGDPSPYRDGARRGEASTDLPPLAFVDFTQTHDQIGNRALGERLGHLAEAARLRALTACVLLAPAVPLLFMGEEFAASTPFLYFCDFAGELAQAVTAGRRNEFSRFARFADPQARDRIPDPNDAATFAASRLDWDQRRQGEHAQWLEFYTRLLRLRRELLMPLLRRAGCGSFHVLGPGRLAVHWPLGEHNLHLLANLADTPAVTEPLPPGEVVYASHEIDADLPPWLVRVTLERPLRSVHAEARSARVVR